MKHCIFILSVLSLFTACAKAPRTIIEQSTITACLDSLQARYPSADLSLAERGIRQAASLWTKEDGSEIDFVTLVTAHYAATPQERTALLESLSRMMESVRRHNEEMMMELQRPIALTNASEPTAVDEILYGYSPSGHFYDDFFANKVAFIAMLNFPQYTLAEKDSLGATWTREEWAAARMGDVFAVRVPGEATAKLYQAIGDADMYIADYNIYMGNLRTEDNRQLWKDDVVLLSHWNLRDELKSNYATGDQDKQEMIYQVMQRIIRQEIPSEIINSNRYIWKPYSNTVEDQTGHPIVLDREPDTRYQHILNTFAVQQMMDRYYSMQPTSVLRNFELDMEIPEAEVEQIFTRLLSSNEAKAVAALIRERLGRDLRPYDIWYDGFKSRSAVSEDELTAKTRRLYPDAEAYHRDMPRMLQNIGFTAERAQFLTNHISVDPARGSGHALPTAGHEMNARLRTRIAPTGMDYKGYNIAVHEMGHNVEETTSMWIDQYLLAGIPNTGYTEASAFLFQQRDLQLLGYGTHSVDDNTVLDVFWGMYEIMGVGLVDMYMWRWMYSHPKATAAQLREAVVSIAKEVWNTYYYPLLGEKDCILLGVYSHMVNSPQYLPNYPIGHLVHFQLEEHLSQCKSQADWAKEYTRIYQQGRLTPQQWMIGAVGTKLSVEPVLRAVSRIMTQKYQK